MILKMERSPSMIPNDSHPIGTTLPAGNLLVTAIPIDLSPDTAAGRLRILWEATADPELVMGRQEVQDVATVLQEHAVMKARLQLTQQGGPASLKSVCLQDSAWARTPTGWMLGGSIRSQGLELRPLLTFNWQTLSLQIDDPEGEIPTATARLSGPVTMGSRTALDDGSYQALLMLPVQPEPVIYPSDGADQL